MNDTIATFEARPDVQVRAALASGPVSVIVLGAAHDLSASVQKLGGGTTQYMRVVTASVQRFARPQ